MEKLLAIMQPYAFISVYYIYACAKYEEFLFLACMCLSMCACVFPTIDHLGRVFGSLG